MTDDRSTLEGTLETASLAAGRTSEEAPCLVVCWSREEPHRIGEIGFVGEDVSLGRGGARPEDGAPRVALGRQRPGAFTLTGPIGTLRISRAQLRLRAAGEGVEVESTGRCPLLINGVELASGAAAPGDTIQLKNELVLLVARRPRLMAPLASLGAVAVDFGACDPWGHAGESPPAWRLRDALAFAAASSEHVLVRGESGTGKELAARALHELSSRRARRLVSRNAATVPEGLVDAELFGNVKNYPNPGAAEREGLIGEADGSTLFLDEIGELPTHLQAHLLRVLDRGGEHQRLGDARVRRADLRVVAATNRPLDALKHDFLARLTLRVEVPSLDDRREDIPLLVRHVLRRAAETSEHVDRRFFAATPGGERLPRVSAALVDRLVRHAYSTHTRELEQLLWQALGESPGEQVELTEGVARKLAASLPSSSALTRDHIEACLAKNGQSVTRAARDLGLKNRFTLYRVMKKLGMSAGDAVEVEGESD